jgi:Flp pilus assembly protein TadG
MFQRRLGNQQGTAMAEAAIVLPVVVLITLAMINLSLAWFVAISAGNAANYGTRIGSVSQSDPAVDAAAAAQSRVDAIGIGTYTVEAIGGGERGDQIQVSVDWEVPSFMGSLLSFFGGSDPIVFSGTAHSTFRQEGW